MASSILACICWMRGLLLLDEENRNRIDRIIYSLETMAGDLEATASTVKDKSPEISMIISRLNSITASLDSAAASAAGMASDARAVTASLRDAGLGDTVDSLRVLISRIQDPTGSIGRMITSDSLHNSLTRLTNDLDSLVSGIREDPKTSTPISVFSNKNVIFLKINFFLNLIILTYKMFKILQEFLFFLLDFFTHFCHSLSRGTY